jgi:cobalt-zinc-cadmium efflux system membrane fusion protein
MTSRTRIRTYAMSGAIVLAACSGKAGSPASGDVAKTPAATDSSDAKPFTLTTDQLARIKVTAVAPTSFNPVISTTGTAAFNADRSTSVTAPISGPVTKLLTDVGAIVHRGAPLATLTSPDFAAAVATYRKADAAYKNFKRIADQDEQMFKADAIAKRDVEQAQTDAASAAADRDASVEQMRSLGMDEPSIAAILENRGGVSPEAVIRAPIDGVVVEKLVSAGQLIEAGAAGVAGTPVFTIADLSTIWVWANVFEADLAMVEAGETATVTTAAWPRPIPGKVTYVSAMVDTSTRATAVRVEVENPSHVLKRGMFLDVNITSNRTRTGMLIPVAAVMRNLENLPFVFVQQADKSFVRRRVTLGFRVKDMYEITSGLSTGDHVVSDGALFIQFAQSQ